MFDKKYIVKIVNKKDEVWFLNDYDYKNIIFVNDVFKASTFRSKYELLVLLKQDYFPEILLKYIKEAKEFSIVSANTLEKTLIDINEKIRFDKNSDLRVHTYHFDLLKVPKDIVVKHNPTYPVPETQLSYEYIEVENPDNPDYLVHAHKGVSFHFNDLAKCKEPFFPSCFDKDDFLIINSSDLDKTDYIVYTKKGLITGIIDMFKFRHENKTSSNEFYMWREFLYSQDIYLKLYLDESIDENTTFKVITGNSKSLL